MSVSKKTIPHPSEARGDEDHLRFAAHAFEQIKAGHYTVNNVVVGQQEIGPGGVRLVIALDRWETHPDNPSAHHGLHIG